MSRDVNRFSLRCRTEFVGNIIHLLLLGYICYRQVENGQQMAEHLIKLYTALISLRLRLPESKGERSEEGADEPSNTVRMAHQHNICKC